MQGGEQAAAQLEALLHQQPQDANKLAAALEAITANCKSCHQTYRDVPLGEKKPKAR
jgi:cytochrome c556